MHLRFGVVGARLEEKGVGFVGVWDFWGVICRPKEGFRVQGSGFRYEGYLGVKGFWVRGSRGNL